jgi:putative flippase GtrA
MSLRLPSWHNVRHSFSLTHVFLRYVSSSAIAASADYLVFLISFHITRSAIFSIFAGRIVSLIISYFMQKRFVFQSQAQFLESFTRYAGLVLLNGLIASISVDWLVQEVHISALIAKIMTEILLYGVNFLILRRVFMPVAKGNAQRNLE